MKEILNWIVRKDNEIIEYVKGTKKAVELYLNKLQENDTDNDSDYDAVGCESEFNEKIKFKILKARFYERDGGKVMARLTGLDADGHIISTEEERLLVSKGYVDKDEMYKIMMHLAEKLYEYENADDEYCKWKINSAFPETINNPHVAERENIATAKYCPCCGKKIKIVN